MIMVVLWVILEIIFILTISILRFIYDFQFKFLYYWKSYHSAYFDFQNCWGGYSYEDSNPLETIKRRYTRTFE